MKLLSTPKLFVSLILLSICFFIIIFLNQQTENSSSLSTEEKFAGSTDTYDAPASLDTTSPLPEKAYIKVPFTTQAPKVNWDEIHEEACEEASLIMIKHFLEKTEITKTDAADEEILELVNWETANGYGVDVTLSQLNEIAKNYYGIGGGEVKTNANIDDIKREIAMGRPVIVGAAGKILPNPNFRNGGPLYHMLVVVGYDMSNFITNDPGTRKGQNFLYTHDELFNAIHDWDSTNILNGGKNYLVFK